LQKTQEKLKKYAKLSPHFEAKMLPLGQFHQKGGHIISNIALQINLQTRINYLTIHFLAKYFQLQMENREEGEKDRKMSKV